MDEVSQNLEKRYVARDLLDSKKLHVWHVTDIGFTQDN